MTDITDNITTNSGTSNDAQGSKKSNKVLLNPLAVLSYDKDYDPIVEQIIKLASNKQDMPSQDSRHNPINEQIAKPTSKKKNSARTSFVNMKELSLHANDVGMWWL